jgi:hypothetical protein
MAYDFCEIAPVPRLCAVDYGFNRHNVGGMNEAIFFPENYVISFPPYNVAFAKADTPQLVGSIILRAGAVGYRFRFTPETGEYTEPQTETDDGVYYDQTFTLSIPKDRPEISWLKHRMSQGRYAMIYRDANGATKALRNLRVKMDLATGKAGADYNGHVLYARRAAIQPSWHWQLAPTSALESLFVESNISLDNYMVTLPQGWQAGRQIVLPFTPISSDSLLVVYNNVLYLLPGEHYTLNGATVTLLDADAGTADAPGELLFFYACNRLENGLTGWEQEYFEKSTSYSSGETITLSTAPASLDHVHIRYNDALALRPGIDFSLSGTTITLLKSSTPPSGDPDRFFITYATAGLEPIAISGWTNYRHVGPALVATDTILLPHAPIAGSLFLKLEESFLLVPGLHYNLTGNEVEILFDVPAGTVIDAWYCY